MQTIEPTDLQNKIAEKVLDAAFIVHRELGPGLLENIYELCMADLLADWGYEVIRQKPFSVPFMGKELDTGYRVDLVVNNSVLVELKSIDKLAPVHEAQILTYLKLSKIQLGLLINFNVPLLKQGIKRFVLTQNRGARGVRGGLNKESIA